MSSNPSADNGTASTGRAELPVVVFAALFPTFGAWLYFVRLSDGPLFQIAYLGCKAIQFGLPVAWLLLSRGAWRRDGPQVQHVDSSGIAAVAARREGARPLEEKDRRGGPGRMRHLTVGLLSGALISGVICAGYVFMLRGGPAASAAAQRVAERLAAMGATTPLRYALLAVFIAILHSWLEEYYWRWFLFRRIRIGTSFRAAALLSSLAFASHHVVVLWTYLGTGPGAWLMGPLTIGVVLGGLLWAWLYERSASILPGWVSHVMADLAIMAMGWDLALAAR